ncbi:MAG: DUF4157 domain-containing protein [Sterolibacteriaceae bacterium]|nr:DUF4157 domain-containing protein [Sterolibacteriaceae bacterium]MBK9085112.1 DUF4157 domain-containing protein [Sterolibacteriaceae bacterium]
MPDSTLLAYLLSAAASLSGYPQVAVDALPPIVRMSAAEMRRAVCDHGQNSCADMAAVFDTDGGRILLRDDLDLDSAADNSFLVHELVHVLQHRQRGGRIFAGCHETLRTEREAYAVQNRYLKREGQFLRFGEGLAFMRCADVQPASSSGDVSLDYVGR